jgi:murein hydrolase activator
VLLPAYAQQGKSKPMLERERQRLEQDIETTRRQLEEARQGQRHSLAEVKLLEYEIAQRERRLRTIGQELSTLDGEIGSLGRVIESMQKDVGRLQSGYSKVVQQANRQPIGLSPVLWLMGAESFGQAYTRLMYVREVGRFRQSQIDLIRRTQTYLGARRLELNRKRGNKRFLADESRVEAGKLAKAKQQKSESIKSLQAQELSYNSQLRKFRKELAIISREIDKVIRAETEVDRTAPRTAQQRTAGIRITGLFERNRGRLPWPVAITRGVVTSQFGVSSDASGGKVQNLGIYISTERGQNVRAVFSGKVCFVGKNKAIGNFLMVQHGKYRSVYVGLRDMLVKEGEEVTTLQNLGVVDTNDRSGATELQFLIYEERNPTDPLQWIIRKQ